MARRRLQPRERPQGEDFNREGFKTAGQGDNSQGRAQGRTTLLGTPKKGRDTQGRIKGVRSRGRRFKTADSDSRDSREVLKGGYDSDSRGLDGRFRFKGVRRSIQRRFNIPPIQDRRFRQEVLWCTAQGRRRKEDPQERIIWCTAQGRRFSGVRPKESGPRKEVQGKWPKESGPRKEEESGPRKEAQGRTVIWGPPRVYGGGCLVVCLVVCLEALIY